MDIDSGCGKAETGVQAESLTAAMVSQSCRALALAVGVTAAAKAGTQGYDRSWERQGDMK